MYIALKILLGILLGVSSYFLTGILLILAMSRTVCLKSRDWAINDRSALPHYVALWPVVLGILTWEGVAKVCKTVNPGKPFSMFWDWFYEKVRTPEKVSRG